VHLFCEQVPVAPAPLWIVELFCSLGMVGYLADCEPGALPLLRAATDASAHIPMSEHPIHDLDDIDVELPDGDYATVAGLVLEHLGRIPSVGDRVTITDWQIEVRSMERHSITEVALAAFVLPHVSTETTEELS